MKFIDNIQSSISLKLLSAFLLIIGLSLLALLLTLGALNKTREAQNHLTQQALPLLRVSQDFSQSLFKYLIFLERASLAQASSVELAQQIGQRERYLKSNLQALQQLAEDKNATMPIAGLLNDIVLSSTELQPLVFSQRPQLVAMVEAHIETIRQNLSKIREHIRRHQIITRVQGFKHQNITLSIEDELVRIDEILGQYNQTTNSDELKYFKSRYTVSIRKITQQVLQIEDQQFKENIAIQTSELFNHIDKENLFFKDAARLNKNIFRTQEILKNNKLKEQKFNALLGALLEGISREADREIVAFDAIINRNINLLIAIIVTMMAASGGVLYFYVIPRITRRLNQLASDTKQISSHQYDTHIDTTGTDEIAQMANALNGFKLALIEKRKTDQRIKDREARLSNIIDNAVDGLITIDHQGIIENFNPACETMFGYTAGEMLGKNVSLLMPPHNSREHDTYIRNYQTTGERKIIGIGREVEGQRKDGSLFPMDLSISEISLSGKTLFSGIIRDISERKKIESEREQLITKLVDSNEELERFAFVCSHDLQEPLRMIRSFSDKLRNHIGESLEGDEKGEKYLRFMTEGATRAQSLIADILTYSSIGSDTQALEEVSCADLVNSIKTNISVGLEQRQGKVTFDSLPTIRGNKTQLFQLLQNLINNGIKYQKPDSTPCVHISATDKGDYWQFSVTDNGIGMEKRHLKKIFDVFQRLHRKSQYAGTGVGLSICKKVVERHGGDIWATSEKGAGSIFYFTLLKTNNKRID